MEQKQKDSTRLITPGGAGLAVVCFFLPWVRACGQDLSGAQIASNGSHELWLILVAAIVIIGGFFIFDRQNNFKKMKPIVLVCAILSLLIMLLKLIQIKKEGGNIIEIQYGSVGTVIGFIASLFGLKFLKDSISDIKDK